MKKIDFMTQNEARRAIYIDFEGFMKKPPSLLGILIEDRLEQVVLDERLRLASDAKGLRTLTLSTIVDELLMRSRKEDRYIVAFTQHEKRVVQAYAEFDLGDRYRDAHKIAKWWKKLIRPTESIEGYGLKDFLKFIGYPRQDYLGIQQSTSRLRYVIEMVSKKGDYKKLTSGAKAKWTKLLQHNKIDCTGMCALTLRAAKEMETAG